MSVTLHSHRLHSPMKDSKQLILGSTLFAVGTVACIALVQCVRSNGDDVVWLIPEDYRGYVVLIEGRKDGEEKVYENGSRLYRFPHSGILKTRFGINRGRHKERCYLIDLDGNRRELKIRYSKNDLKDIREGEPYLTAGNSSFPSPFPYQRFFARILVERGSEDFSNDHNRSNLKDFLLSYAKENNDI